jgi:hypothetical protein
VTLYRIDAMARFQTGKRRKQRTRMVVPVRVRLAGTKGQAVVAHTLDATEHGVRLAGYHAEVKMTDILEIQHRRESALFPSRLGSRSRQIGREAYWRRGRGA